MEVKGVWEAKHVVPLEGDQEVAGRKADRKLPPLLSYHFCRSSAKHLVVTLGLLLRDRAGGWGEKLDTAGESPEKLESIVSASVGHNTCPRQLSEGNGCRVPHGSAVLLADLNLY